MEAILETKTETILQFIRGLGGSLHVTFEEGTSAAWLYDLLKPHVTKVVVCDPRKNPLLRVGNHNDREDARKLSELLYLNKLSSVFHDETGIRTLRELARSYLTITRDLTRVMNRLKAIYRGGGIACTGQQVNMEPNAVGELKSSNRTYGCRLNKYANFSAYSVKRTSGIYQPHDMRTV